MAKYICPRCTLETDQEICPDCGEKNELMALPSQEIPGEVIEKYSESELKEAEKSTSEDNDN